jgi:hypothetical protein
VSDLATQAVAQEADPEAVAVSKLPFERILIVVHVRKVAVSQTIAALLLPVA